MPIELEQREWREERALPHDIARRQLLLALHPHQPERPDRMNHTPEALQLVCGHNLVYLRSLFFRQVCVLVKLGFEALHFFEQVYKLAARGIALEVCHIFRRIGQVL